MFNLVMHWINWPLRRAKVDERLLWWSVGQTCYQVPLSTIDKLVCYLTPHRFPIWHPTLFGTILSYLTPHVPIWPLPSSTPRSSHFPFFCSTLLMYYFYVHRTSTIFYVEFLARPAHTRPIWTQHVIKFLSLWTTHLFSYYFPHTPNL
jgi:hypothetical protein